MKKIICLIIFIFTCTYAFADGIDDVFDSSLKNNVENAFEIANIDIDAVELIEKLNKGDFDFGIENIKTKIKDSLFFEFKNNFKTFSYIFILIILSSLVDIMQFSESHIIIIKKITVAVVIISLISIVYNISESSLILIDKLILFINSIIPTLLMLLANGGNPTTSSLLNPVMLGLTSFITTIIKSFILPVNIMGLSLKLTGEFSDKEYMSNFGNQLYKILKWMLGIMISLYVGIIGVLGVAAPKIDQITLKTTKYAVGSFIPYVGGMVADSVELILVCISVVKNSIGIAGMIGVLTVIIMPCISIFIKSFCVWVLSVIVSPVSDKSVINSINTVSTCINILFSLNIIISLMFILSFAVIICVGGT